MQKIGITYDCNISHSPRYNAVYANSPRPLSGLFFRVIPLKAPRRISRLTSANGFGIIKKTMTAGGYMKKEYLLSGLILSLLTFVIFLIATVNEDISNRVVFLVVFPIITFALSFPGALFSKQIIRIGDKISKKAFRTLFYLAMPLVSIGLFCGTAALIYYLDDMFPAEGEFNAILGRGLLVVFVLITVFIVFLLPSVQTLIVLLIKALQKRDD